MRYGLALNQQAVRGKRRTAAKPPPLTNAWRAFAGAQ